MDSAKDAPSLDVAVAMARKGDSSRDAADWLIKIGPGTAVMYCYPWCWIVPLAPAMWYCLSVKWNDDHGLTAVNRKGQRWHCASCCYGYISGDRVFRIIILSKDICGDYYYFFYGMPGHDKDNESQLKRAIDDPWNHPLTAAELILTPCKLMQFAKAFINKAGKEAEITPALLKSGLVNLMKETAQKAKRNVDPEHMTLIASSPHVEAFNHRTLEKVEHGQKLSIQKVGTKFDAIDLKLVQTKKLTSKRRFSDTAFDKKSYCCYKNHPPLQGEHRIAREDMSNHTLGLSPRDVLVVALRRASF